MAVVGPYDAGGSRGKAGRQVSERGYGSATTVLTAATVETAVVVGTAVATAGVWCPSRRLCPLPHPARYPPPTRAPRPLCGVVPQKAGGAYRRAATTIGWPTEIPETGRAPRTPAVGVDPEI